MAATAAVDDFTFLMTCLVNSTNEFPKPDYEKVAAQIGAKSASACYHRLWHIKKNWGLTNSSSGGGGAGGKKGKGVVDGAAAKTTTTTTTTKSKAAGRKPKPKPSDAATATAIASGGVKRGRPKKPSLAEIVAGSDDDLPLLGTPAKKLKTEEDDGGLGEDDDVVVKEEKATLCAAN